MSGATFEETHDDEGRLRLDREPPLADAVPERPVHELVAGLQCRCRERLGCAGGHGYSDRAPGRLASIVDTGDLRRRILRSGVDQSHQALLVFVDAGVEDRNPVTVAVAWRLVVHCREESVLGSDVGHHLDVQIARQFQPPVTLTRTRASGQSLLDVAKLEIVGIEVHRLVRTDRERQRIVFPGRVVVRLDGHLAYFTRKVDYAHEPLPSVRVRRRGKQRHRVQPVVFVVGCRRQVRQVPRRVGQQAHDHQVPVRLHSQLPHTVAIAKRTAQSRSATRLQLGCGERLRSACGDRHRHGAPGRFALPVDARHRHLGAFVPEIDQPQQADLALVAPRVERHNPVVPIHNRHHVVHRGDETIGRAHVGEHLDVELAGQR